METEVISEGMDAFLKISGKFGMRLIIDMVFVMLLLKFIYIKRYKSKDYVFTFFVFNIVIFSVAFLLNKIELSLGAAFGLFAVFGMLRYKTEEISIKDMTYLFLNIAIGLICAVTKIKGEDAYEYMFLIGLNTIIFVIIYLLESNVFMKRESMKLVVYEKIENIKANDNSQLIADLRERTGIDIHRVAIQKIDFLKDAAQIKIYYYE